jgi:hypothetical protein
MQLGNPVSSVDCGVILSWQAPSPRVTALVTKTQQEPDARLHT